MNEEEFSKEIQEAKKRVEYMDKVDNFKDRFHKTILSALKTGIMRPETKAQFEAYFMLEEVTQEKEDKKDGR